MLQDEFVSTLKQCCDGVGLIIDQDRFEELYFYFSELQKWGRKINLISKSSSAQDILESHFFDSLTLLLHVGGDSHLLDVGTGAGLPGLVCKIACPEMKVTLVEPRLKRVTFLGHMIRSLKLDGVQVVAKRIEDETALASDVDATHITSRAVSDIGLFVEMVARFTNPGARVICMKGPRWEQELESAQKEHGVNTENMKITKVTLPFSKKERVLVDFLLHTN